MRIVVFIGFSFLCLACDPEKNTVDEAERVMTVTAAPDTIGVGISVPLTLTVAASTPDAKGQMCTFSSSLGTFKQNDSVRTKSIALDYQGNASVDWFPPNSPATVRIVATVGSVNAETRVLVFPVPWIHLDNLPDSILAADSFLFRVSVPNTWGNLPIEARTSTGSLRAIGSAYASRDTGNRILPYLDNSGRTEILFIAPTTVGRSTVSATLFGTEVSSTLIVH
jgi:hypothetical protein